MFSLPAANWLRLFAWLAGGLLIYFFYGKKHSTMNSMSAEDMIEKAGK
jgi:APA family basic amino acid/polyamine antiporter